MFTLPFWLTAAIVLVVFTAGMALINRFRGMERVLPFSNKYLAWAMAGLLAFSLTLNWHFALVVAVGYLMWYWPGWMRWVSMGKSTEAYGQGRALTTDEMMVDDIVWFFLRRFSARVGLFVRGTIWFVPLAAYLVLLHMTPLPLLIPIIGFVPGYMLGWAYGPVDPVEGRDPCVIGEPFAGGLLGFALGLIVLLA